MIERKFIAENIKEFQIKEFIMNEIRNAGHSGVQLKKTPLGDKVIVRVARPGLIVGDRGSTIKLLTIQLKKQFNLENPQIEIEEVKDVNLDAEIIAEQIAKTLERFGSQRFKGVMHKALERIMTAGAMGAEILVSGKVPSSRAKSWRVYAGYLKKCGDIAKSKVGKSAKPALLKSGIVGIKVSIMLPNTPLPDRIKISEKIDINFEEVPIEEAPKAKKKAVKKRQPKKVKNED